MSFTATVENDVIKLPPGVHLPDGTKVIVEAEEPKRRSLAQRYSKMVGVSEGLPADLARNLDHYVHGQPKES